MAKKKIKIRKSQSGKTWRDWFSWAKRSQSRATRTEEKEKLSRRIKIAAMSIFLPLLPAGLVVGFFYLEKYVNAQQQASPSTGPLVFVRGGVETEVPGPYYILNKDTAKTIAEELSSKTWIYNIQVQTKSTKVVVHADYRIPSACIKVDTGKTLYVGLPAKNDPLASSDITVFVSDYTVDTPPTIEIVGFADKTRPVIGQVWHAPDVAAALKLLAALKGMDDKICPKKPLRAEIASIDITNYEGRKAGPTLPHIIFRLNDGIPVYWGAALGKAASYFEDPDEDKLNRLYTFYQQNKYTLLGQGKFIELYKPMSGVPRPQ